MGWTLSNPAQQQALSVGCNFYRNIEMIQKLYYIELKTGFNDDGPAWIGKAFFSKSGRTIYFNGLILKGSGKGICHDIETGDMYWSSGIKKNGQDRHSSGHGKIKIDKNVIDEYLEILGTKELPKNKFIITQLDNIPRLEKANQLENQKINSLQ
jgi:hypothetical protein